MPRLSEFCSIRTGRAPQPTWPTLRPPRASFSSRLSLPRPEMPARIAPAVAELAQTGARALVVCGSPDLFEQAPDPDRADRAASPSGHIRFARIRDRGRADQLLGKRHRSVSPSRDLCRKNIAGSQTGGPARAAAEPARTGREFEDGENTRYRGASADPGACRRNRRMTMRLCGHVLAVAWLGRPSRLPISGTRLLVGVDPGKTRWRKVAVALDDRGPGYARNRIGRAAPAGAARRPGGRRGAGHFRAWQRQRPVEPAQQPGRRRVARGRAWRPCCSTC